MFNLDMFITSGNADSRLALFITMFVIYLSVHSYQALCLLSYYNLSPGDKYQDHRNFSLCIAQYFNKISEVVQGLYDSIWQ